MPKHANRGAAAALLTALLLAGCGSGSRSRPIR